MIEDAAIFIEDSEPNSHLVGYVMIAMYSDGAERASSFRPRLEALTEGPPRYLGRSLFHAWAHKALDSTLAYAEGCDAANQAFENNGFTMVPPPEDDPA